MYLLSSSNNPSSKAISLLFSFGFLSKLIVFFWLKIVGAITVLTFLSILLLSFITAGVFFGRFRRHNQFCHYTKIF